MFTWSYEWFRKDMETATLAMLKKDREEAAKKTGKTG